MIVKEFGDKTLDIILSSPYELEKIKGISHSKAMKIGKAFEEQRTVSEIVMYFHRYKIESGLALNIYKKYGAEAIKTFQDNPYKLVEDINGIGFKTVDGIATSIGIKQNSIFRITSGIIFILQESIQNGNVFLPYKLLINQCVKFLEINENETTEGLKTLLLEGKIYVLDGEYGNHVYLAAMHISELKVANKIKDLANRSYQLNENVFKKVIESFELLNGIKLAEKQVNAVRASAQNGIVIITGGPGTGKTTIIKAILHLLNSIGISTALAAPTGRAAKRITDTCACEAKTIHRLLEINYLPTDDNEATFNKNESSPLDADAVIIDEVSMMDILLMNNLLKAMKDNSRLILVGDRDQLPSVGPGKVLRDLIDSEYIYTVVLDEIYRQTDVSLIPSNAHKINCGEMPLLNVRDKDFFMIKRNSAYDVTKTVAELCLKRLPDAYGVDPFRDIQVIAPSRKGYSGVKNTNLILQETLNPANPNIAEKELYNVIFREGDRVMQCKNNYAAEWVRMGNESITGQGVFNGEMGVLQKINLSAKEATVVFDNERVVIYDFTELEQLEHCYAITIHKSQGSEFDYVIIPVFNGPKLLMTRNLLYTAITRAKKMVILVGDEDTIKAMIDNNSEVLRYSGLKGKILS